LSLDDVIQRNFKLEVVGKKKEETNPDRRKYE